MNMVERVVQRSSERRCPNDEMSGTRSRDTLFVHSMRSGVSSTGSKVE